MHKDFDTLTILPALILNSNLYKRFSFEFVKLNSRNDLFILFYPAFQTVINRFSLLFLYNLLKYNNEPKTSKRSSFTYSNSKYYSRA